MRLIFNLLFILFFTSTAYSQKLETRLDSLLQGHVTKGEIHGCLAYVFQNNKVVMCKPYGYKDIENKVPIQENTIFRIASMTKVLTAAAALKLYEEGKFLLDEPVKKYIPEFGSLRVLSPECKSEDNLITLPLERDVTIRDLFRHTAGFTYGGNDIIGRIYRKKAGNSPDITLEQFTKAILSAPLKYQPGSRWEYSFANDVLGYLVEVISKKPLDVYMEEAIFKPMGMNSSGFYVTKDKIDRLSNHYTYTNGKLVLTDDAKTGNFSKRPTFISGGGGGVTSVDDYSKFCQMILNYGEYNGTRVLSKQTVELLISNQIGEITNRGFEVSGFGFGIGVTPGKYSGHTRICSWSGSPYNTTFMIDFEKNMIAILLVQNGPWTHLGLMDKFQKIVSEEIKL
jgi:CubicO group peptidase (beta-lactamase class C family)